MWYSDSFLKYAMAIIGPVQDSFCPFCISIGIKSLINEVERNDKSGIFYGCSNFRKGCRYSYDKENIPNTPPLTGIQADMLLESQKGNKESERYRKIYCPLCAMRRKKSEIVLRMRKSDGKKFLSCSSNNASNNFKSCIYNELVDGKPLSGREVDKIIYGLVMREREVD